MQKNFMYTLRDNAKTGSSLEYRVLGKGKPIVLIHGFGEDSRVWNETITELEKKYKLIVPDLPGSGYSDILQKLKPTIANFADCIKAILDKEKIKSCTIIGHSMGGYITVEFVHKYPEMVKAFGLFHSSAYADSKEKKMAREKSMDFIEANGSAKFLKPMIPDLFYNKTKSKTHIKELIDKGKYFESTALLQYLHAMKSRPDRSSVLKKSMVPVLFILGKHDKTIPLEIGLKQSLLPTESHVFILEKSAHMGMLEETETTIGYLAQFLQNF